MNELCFSQDLGQEVMDMCVGGNRWMIYRTGTASHGTADVWATRLCLPYIFFRLGNL